MTKPCHEAPLLKPSIRHFIQQWIQYDKMKNSAAELKGFSDLKAERDSRQPAQ